jgi:hypothetical protein
MKVMKMGQPCANDEQKRAWQATTSSVVCKEGNEGEQVTDHLMHQICLLQGASSTRIMFLDNSG